MKEEIERIGEINRKGESQIETMNVMYNSNTRQIELEQKQKQIDELHYQMEYKEQIHQMGDQKEDQIEK